MANHDDWRLGNHSTYLTGRTLHWAKWYSWQPGWDHDHCAFCWARFTDKDSPDVLHEGYTTEDDYHWICPTCFNDFKEMFAWKVAAAESKLPGA